MYRDILVHFDGSERSLARLALAARLVRPDGRLTAVFARTDPDPRAMIARRPSDALADALVKADIAFTEAAQHLGVPTDWISVPNGDPDFLIRELVICSRFFDLTVLGQAEPDHPLVPSELNEEVIRHSGAPVLMVPYVGETAPPGRRVMVAWNGSLGAARAVRDAMPIMAAADEVKVLGLHARTEQPSDMPKVNIVDRLRRAGIHATYDVMPQNEVGVMDMLMSAAADASSDLIVMGAFGEEGVPGFGRAAGTRYMLRHMTVPVFMAH